MEKICFNIILIKQDRTYSRWENENNSNDSPMIVFQLIDFKYYIENCMQHYFYVLI